MDKKQDKPKDKPKKLSYIELGRIMLKAYGPEKCRKGYDSVDPEEVGWAAIAWNDINWDGMLN